MSTQTIPAPVAPETRETVDFDRLDKVIEWAEGEYHKQINGLASEWDQEAWITDGVDTDCGTACCVAGKVGLDDGVLRVEFEALSYKTIFERPAFPGSDQTRSMEVSEYARRVLGLDQWEADRLFGSLNKLGDLKRLRDEFADERGVPLRYDFDEQYEEGVVQDDDEDYSYYDDEDEVAEDEETTS